MFIPIYWAGTVLGFIAGVIHAVDIVRKQASLSGKHSQSIAWYRAAWAVLLWTAFGGYLLLMWIFGLILRPLLGFFWRRRSAR